MFSLRSLKILKAAVTALMRFTRDYHEAVVVTPRLSPLLLLTLPFHIL